MNVVPRPSSLFTSMLPPCMSTAFFTIASPRPVPWIAPTLLARWNDSNRCDTSSGGMPMPWSATSNTVASSSRRTLKPTWPPPGEYFSALDSRLLKMWRSSFSS